VLHEFDPCRDVPGQGHQVRVLDLGAQRLAHTAFVPIGPAQAAFLERVLSEHVVTSPVGIGHGEDRGEVPTLGRGRERAHHDLGIGADGRGEDDTAPTSTARDVLEDRCRVLPHRAGDAVVLEVHGRVVDDREGIAGQSPQLATSGVDVVAQRDRPGLVQQQPGHECIAQHRIDADHHADRKTTRTGAVRSGGSGTRLLVTR
jgi:hypothetical protein